MTTKSPVILEYDLNEKLLKEHKEYEPSTNPNGIFFLLNLYYQDCEKDGDKLRTSIPIVENTIIPLDKQNKYRIADINPVLIVRKKDNSDFNKFLEESIIDNESDGIKKNSDMSIISSYIKRGVSDLVFDTKFDNNNWYSFGYGTALSLTNYVQDKTDTKKNLYCYDYTIGNLNLKKFVLRIYIQYGDLPNSIKYTPYNPNQQSLCSPT